MKRKRRLPKEKYLALQKFKRKVNEERVGLLIRDHSGHLYRTNEDGSLQRCGRDDLREAIKEHAPGVVYSRGDTRTTNS